MSSENSQATEAVANQDHIDELSHKLRVVISRMMLSNYTKLISIVLYRFRFEICDVNDPPLNGEGLACVMWDHASDADQPIPIIWLSTCLHSWSEQELAFLVIHEILHVLDRHNRRLLSADPMLKNLAGDHVINTRLKEDIDLGNKIIAVPSEAYFAPGYNKKNTTMEEVYTYLNKHKPQPNPGRIGKMDKVKSGGSNSKNGEVHVSKDIKSDGGKQEKQQNAEKNVCEDMSGTIKTASESEPFLSLQKNRGDQSGGLTEFIKSIIEVEIPWEVILEKAIKRIVRAPSENRSWRNINRRMRSHGLIYPDRAKDAESKSNLYILADHSASMSNLDLRKMASLIMQSVNLFQEIVIMKHDTSIVEIVTLDHMSSQQEIEKAITGKGRGGTRHNCVFNEIRDRLEKSEDEEDIGIILMITDFQSNVEQIWDKYEWTKTIPVKVILSDPATVPAKIDDSPILLRKKQE